MPLFRDRARAESFGGVAERYDRTRPSYPPALVDRLLEDGARAVLDVGCGTGIAAALLAARGCHVLGVEPDARMAAVARARGLAVEVAHFEAWKDAGRRFDLLISGQAWHWIDPGPGAAKAATVVSPGGRIGLFWNIGILPEDLRRRLDAVYARLAPGLDDHSAALGARDDRGAEAVAALIATQAFEEPEQHVFPWSRAYTTEEWREQLPTHSDHQTLPAHRLTELLQAVGEVIEAGGGRFEMAYEALLVTARRR